MLTNHGGCLTALEELCSILLSSGRISMKKKETLNFRVPAEFKRKLTEEANKQRRSLTNYLQTTFMQVWDEQETASTTQAQQARKQKRSPK